MSTQFQSTNDCISFSTQGSLEKCISFFEDTIGKNKGELYSIIINAIGQGSVVLRIWTNQEIPIGGGPVVNVTYYKEDGSTWSLFINWKSDHWDVRNRSADSLMPSMLGYGRSMDGLPITNNGDTPYPIHESPYPMHEQPITSKGCHPYSDNRR